MLQLALNYGKKPPMLGDIAKKENLSGKYLSLIVLPLRAHGLINSIRGAKGGYYLAKNHRKSLCLTFFEATDGKVCSVDCLRPKILARD
jgi:Predicted transcriptional regulator